MATSSVDLIISFPKNATVKDAETVYNGLLKHLSGIPGGTQLPLSVSFSSLESRTIRIRSNGGDVSTGVVSTPTPPKPRPPIFPPGNFLVNYTAHAPLGLASIRNFSDIRSVYSLQNLKSTLTNIATGNGFH